MKASEARKLANNTCSSEINQALSRIYKHVELAAKRGSHTVNVSSPSEVAINRVMEQLKNDGYSVKRSVGSDSRDGESWDSLTICWACVD